ncbi:MAG: helix-turn-helix domain-containing protein [Spirochaetes bacterium]|nr:helix-turn-helix domain-containing protein [Spirochaetota bacterium]
MNVNHQIIDFKPLEQTSALSLHGCLKEYSTKTVHVHPFHQILFITAGISLLITDKERKPLYGSMCAFLPAGAPHRTGTAGSSVEYSSIYFKRNLFIPQHDDIVIFRLTPLARELILECTSGTVNDLTVGMKKNYFELLIKMLPEEMQNRILFCLPETSDEICRKIISFIEKNYSRTLHLKDFCSVLPYSEKHIARLFRNRMNISIFEYLRMYRIFKATIKLRNSGDKILDIALDCGYEALSVFYTDFKKYFSMTPGEFRNKN